MRTLAVILCALMLAACATDNREASRARDDQRETVTGSNIPRRDRSGSNVSIMSKEDFERAQNSGSSGVRGAEPK